MRHFAFWSDCGKLANVTASFRKYTLILIAGDAAILTMFALVGRETHAGGDPNLVASALPTLMPFLSIWLLAAALTGALRPAVYRFVPLAVIRTLVAWLVAGPIAIYVRALILARTAIPIPFVVVTLGLNGVLLLAWHVFFAWWFQRAALRR
jgi:hypothetical protein